MHGESGLESDVTYEGAHMLMGLAGLQPGLCVPISRLPSSQSTYSAFCSFPCQGSFIVSRVSVQLLRFQMVTHPWGSDTAPQ